MFSSVGFGRFLSLVLHGVLHGSMRAVKYGTNISWCYLVHMEKETNSARYEWLSN